MTNYQYLEAVVQLFDRIGHHDVQDFMSADYLARGVLSAFEPNEDPLDWAVVLVRGMILRGRCYFLPSRVPTWNKALDDAFTEIARQEVNGK